MTPAQQSALAALAVASHTLTETAAAVAEAVRVLRASLTPVEPPAEPPPPPPKPAPEPSPPPANMTVQSRTLNMARVLLWAPWLEQSRYQRYQKLAIITTVSNTVLLRATDQASGGNPRAFLQPQYTVLVDGAEHVTIAPPAGSTSFAVPFDLSRLAEGWHWIDIRQDGIETCAPYFMYVQHGAQPVPQPFAPVMIGSHSIGSNAQIWWANVPANYAPTTAPMPVREYPASSAPITRASIIQTNLAPWRNGDIYRPMDIGGGCLGVFSRQAYFFDHLTAARPYLPSLDGPRGVGSVSMATHLQVGRTGGVYFTDPWRVGHISPAGTVKTLVGWRHKQPMKLDSMADDAIELMGDWSAIPEGRCGFHELWGMAWDQRTLTVAGDPIPNGANGPEQPHVVGPVMFVADSQRNRVCRIEFDPRSHDTPAKVTEFITGINDPWDLACADGVLYVSERQAHRIAAYDATTGAFLRVVVQGSALAVVRNRKMVRTVGLDITRAQPCVAPEGLFFQDGWLYFASLAQAQIRKIDVNTGEMRIVCDVPVDGQSMFVKIAVGDGTFGPRGMLAATTWSSTQMGRPLLWNPDGTAIGWTNGNGGGQGPGPCFETIGYSGAVGIGNARMVFSSAAEGVIQVSRALPTDKVISSGDWHAARLEYWYAGHELTNGAGGWGFFGLPLPLGKSQELDAYLQAYGHSPDGVN